MEQLNKDKKDEFDQLSELGSDVTKTEKGNIYTLTIIGQIEGHQVAPDTVKTTKYEHVLPLLAGIEESEEIDGLLLLLNEPLKDKSGNVTDNTTQDAIIAALVKRAANGDTRAFEMIRDTIGEKPVQDVKVSTGDFSALDDAFKGMKK